MSELLQESIQRRINHIREVAKTKPETAVALTRESDYTIRRVRVVVDGDCDGVTRGDRYRVAYEPRDGNSHFELQEFDSVVDAATYIEAISRALITADGFGPSGHSMRSGGPYPTRGAYGMQRVR